MSDSLIGLIKEIYTNDKTIPLHRPFLGKDEKSILKKTIDTGFVSTAGKYVEEFEKKIARFTKKKYSISTVNATSGLHIALLANDVKADTEVLCPSLTFVATSNVIRYCNARPVYLEVDSNLNLSINSLKNFLYQNCEIRKDGYCWNRITNKKVTALILVHTLGLPSNEKLYFNLLKKFNIPIIQDNAAALGSYYDRNHLGYSKCTSIISFNGNKIITTGGGGMILTNSKKIFEKCKFLSTTAKKSHPFEFIHNSIGYNYRMPNLNAALGLAQFKKIKKIINKKRKIANLYEQWCINNDYKFIKEIKKGISNYWVNAILFKSKKEKNDFLIRTNNMNIFTRPLWQPMHMLKMNTNFSKANLDNTKYLYDHIVCLPSYPDNLK